MTLEADQAVQEARFAGACQDQHAGRPAPSLGWPGERKSIVQQAETSVVTGRKSIKVTGPGARIFRAWGPGLGAGKRGPGLGAGASRALPPGPAAPPLSRPGRKEEGFHPLRY